MSSKRSEEVEKLALHLEYLFEHGVDFKKRVIQLCPTRDNENEEDKGYELDTIHWSFLDAALSELESHGRGAVTLKIFSFGGSVKTALAIVGRLHASKCKIVTEGYGTIESAATLILACGNERRISRFATFMHHEASYSFHGRHQEALAYVSQADKEEKQWAKWMAEFSAKSAKFYEEQGVGKDVYWSPEELLKYGIVDKII